MGIDKATVTIELGDFDGLRHERDRLERELGEAKVAIDGVRLGNEDVKLLSDAFNSALEVVKFAVANLDPLSYKGWPHRALWRVAKALPGLPGVSEDTKDCAPDVADFARRCRDLELQRNRPGTADEDDLSPEDRAALDSAFDDDYEDDPPPPDAPAIAT